MTEERKLTLYHYMASIMLGTAIVYFWSMMANIFPAFFQESSFKVVTIITIIVYTLGGILISILVMWRTGGKSLLRGMIVGSITAIGTCVYIALLPGTTVLFFAVVYFSYSLGGYLGALIWLKKTKPLTPSIGEHP